MVFCVVHLASQTDGSGKDRHVRSMSPYSMSRFRGGRSVQLSIRDRSFLAFATIRAAVTVRWSGKKMWRIARKRLRIFPQVAYSLLVLFVFMIGLPPGSICCGQEPAPTSRDTDRFPPLPANENESANRDLDRNPIHEIKPEIYYIPDAQGHLRPALLNEITFGDFKKLLGDLAVRQASPPQYVLSSLAITATAKQENIEVAVDVVIENRHDSEETWVRVPLKMGSLILPLQDSVRYEGEGSSFLHYDDRAEGYVVWLRGGTGKQHRLQLSGLVPIGQLGGEHQIRLNIPRATKSDLSLSIPGTDYSVLVTSGGHLREPKTVEGRTEVVVDGVAGDFRLLWRRLLIRNAPRMQAFDVEGRQTIQIEGGQVRTDTTLTVQSFAGPFNHFRIQLPPGARLLSANQSGYSLLETSAAGGLDESQWVDVKLDRMTKGPVEIHLVTQQIRDPNRPDDAIQLAGFDVEGSLRQSGQITVRVSGDWHIRWLEEFSGRFDIRRTDTLPEAAPNAEVVARFEYYRQPYSLRARIEPPTTQIAVEPEYVVDVSTDRVVMDTRLRYQVRGAGIFDVAVDMQGWEIVPGSIGPIELVDIDAVHVDPEGRVQIPLVRSVEGEFEIVIRAERSHESMARSLDLPLPKPIADRRDTTTIIISPSDNVELVPHDTTQLQGSSPASGTLPFGKRQQEPLYYLFAHGQEVPERLTAEFQIRPLLISVNVFSEVRFTQHSVAVTQTLEFDIKHQRIDSLRLRMPRELLDRQGVILRGGKPLPLTVVEDNPDDHDVLLRVPLENVIGKVSLDVQYKLESEKMAPGTLASHTIPLVMPAEGDLVGNYLTMEGSDGLEVDPIGEEWQSIAAEDVAIRERSSEKGNHYECETPKSQLVVLVGVTEQPTGGRVLVRKGWIQTWMTKQVRYDHAAFNLVNRGEYFDFQLPWGVNRSTIEASIDGKPIQLHLLPDQKARIAVSGPETEHRFEIQWSMPRQGYKLGRTQIAMPLFPGGARLQRPIYWQLILPQEEHLLRSPEVAIPGYTWQWQRVGWHRVPLVETSELALWSIGHGTQKEPAGTNSYLFRLPHLPSQVTVETLPRAILVLIPAGIVLLGGILLIYIPKLRRTEVLFMLAVLLLAFGWIYPEPAVILVQMALLGVVLVLLVVLMRRLLIARLPRRYVVERTSGSSERYQSTEFYQPGQSTSSVVTESVGVAVVEPAPVDGSTAGSGS